MKDYTPSKDQQATFCEALMQGETIENLQAQFPNVDVNLPHDGLLPLSWAVQSGKKENVVWLIKCGADVNGRNPGHKKSTALFHLNGSREMFALLVENGARIDARDKSGNTCLHFCSAELVDDCRKGIYVDVPNMSGDTPLHRAYRDKNWAKASKLLECGANEGLVNSKYESMTPVGLKLISATEVLDVDKVQEALMNPLFPDVSSSLRNKVFSAAILELSKSQCLEIEKVRAIFQLLTKNGATPDACDRDRNTGLHFCAAELVDDFRQGINVDEKNGDGNTPLHLSYHNRNWKKASKLLECGANELIANYEGITPLELKIVIAAKYLDADKLQEAVNNPLLSGELRKKALIAGLFELSDFGYTGKKAKRNTILQILIDAGVDLNSEKEISEFGEKKRITFLCKVVKDGPSELKFIETLLNAGARVSGLTLLDACTHWHKRKLVPLLLERGARLNEEEKEEFKGWFTNSFRQRYNLEALLNSMMLLIKAGAEFTYPVFAYLVKESRNAVHSETRNKSAGVFPYFEKIIAILDHIPEPLYDEETGKSMLHCIGSEKLLEYLLNRWPLSINAIDNKGKTPLFCAKTVTEAELLLRYGADSGIRNSKGQRVEDLARNNDRVLDALTDRKKDFNLLFLIANVKRQMHGGQLLQGKDNTVQLFQLFFSLPPDLQCSIISMMIMAPVMNRQSREYCGSNPIHAARVYHLLVSRTFWYTPVAAQSTSMVVLGRSYFNRLHNPHVFSQNEAVIAFVRQTAILRVDEKFVEQFTPDKKEHAVLIEGFIRCIYNEYYQKTLYNLFILSEKLYLNNQQRAIIALVIFEKLSADPNPNIQREKVNQWLLLAKDLDQEVFKIFYTEKKAKVAMERNLRLEQRNVKALQNSRNDGGENLGNAHDNVVLESEDPKKREFKIDANRRRQTFKEILKTLEIEIIGEDGRKKWKTACFGGVDRKIENIRGEEVGSAHITTTMDTILDRISEATQQIKNDPNRENEIYKEALLDIKKLFDNARQQNNTWKAALFGRKETSKTFYTHWSEELRKYPQLSDAILLKRDAAH